MNYCLEVHHIRPRDYLAMDELEKASIMGSGKAHEELRKQFEKDRAKNKK